MLDLDDNLPRFVDTIYEGYIRENQIVAVTKTGSTSDLAVQVSGGFRRDLFMALN